MCFALSWSCTSGVEQQHLAGDHKHGNWRDSLCSLQRTAHCSQDTRKASALHYVCACADHSTGHQLGRQGWTFTLGVDLTRNSISPAAAARPCCSRRTARPRPEPTLSTLMLPAGRLLPPSASTASPMATSAGCRTHQSQVVKWELCCWACSMVNASASPRCFGDGAHLRRGAAQTA